MQYREKYKLNLWGIIRYRFIILSTILFCLSACWLCFGSFWITREATYVDIIKNVLTILSFVAQFISISFLLCFLISRIGYFWSNFYYKNVEKIEKPIVTKDDDDNGPIVF